MLVRTASSGANHAIRAGQDSKSVVKSSRDVAERPQDRSPLFRSEVLEEQQNRTTGTVLLLPQLSFQLFTAFGVALAAAVVAILVWGEFTRKERVAGWLMPERGLVRVLAPQSGVITALEVTDGIRVSRGEPLFTLSTELQSEALGETQGEIVRQLVSRRDSLDAERRLTEQLLREEEEGIERRLAALSEEQSHLEDELEIQQAQVTASRGIAERLRDLSERRITSVQRLEEAEQNALEQEMRLRSLERQRASVRRERLEIEAERRALPLRSQARLAELDRNVATVEQELAEAEARRQIVVTANQSGLVAAVRADVGSSVTASAPLLSIVPEGSDLVAQLFAPSSAVGFIRPGQEVLLRYRPFPYQKFGHHVGAIKNISRTSVSPNELGDHLAGMTSLLTGAEPVYLVDVALERQSIAAYGDEVSLQPGMQLEADILIERRRLYEWMFDPLFTLTGRVGA